MLGKLCKYEWKSTAHVLLPCLGGGLVGAGVVLLIQLVLQALPIPTDGFMLVMQRVLELVGGLAVLSVLLLTVVAFVVGVVRFYRFLGDEGYVLHTLPVTVSQHIAAKLLVACAWQAIFLLLGVLAFFCAILPSGEMYLVAEFVSPSLCVALCVSLLVGLLSSYLLLYLAMAIGAQWPGARLVASIIAYYALSVCLQILMLAAMFILGTVLFAIDNGEGFMYTLLQTAAATPTSAVMVLLLCVDVFMLVVGAAAYLWTRRLLTRKLNLA